MMLAETSPTAGPLTPAPVDALDEAPFYRDDALLERLIVVVGLLSSRRGLDAASLNLLQHWVEMQ